MPPKPYVHRSYTHLQLIAWEHFTDTETKPGEETQINATKPNPADPDNPLPIFTDKMPLDERIRLKRLLGIVETARDKIKNTDSANTLKIFMAPEFTFRPRKDETANAKNEGIGSGDTYTRDAMLRIIETMRAMFSDEKYRDWLFVPGTIFWSEPVKTEVVEKNILGMEQTRIVDDYVFFNTALMIKGGAVNAPFTFLHKHTAAKSDPLDPKKSADKNPLFKNLLGKKSDRKFNVLDTDGIRFGLEVCLDHGAQHLKNAVMQEYFVEEKGEPPFVDVHLLVACNKDVVPHHLAITENGYFMRVDGFLGMASVLKQMTPGYGSIPCKSSSIFRCVPENEMPAEYAQDAPNLVAQLPDDVTRMYISHLDASGESMLTPDWSAEPWGALETYAPQGKQKIVAYKPQPFTPRNGD